MSFGEKSLLQQTESLLIEEISIVTNAEIGQVAKQLENLVGYTVKPNSEIAVHL